MNFDPSPTRLLARRHLYPLIAPLLALGAPGGLLLLRLLVSGAAPDLAWIADELRTSWPTYLYMTVSTSTVFAILGYLLGAREDRLEQTSLTDALTGLPNRRHMRTRLGEEFAEAQRYGRALSFLLIDVDGLKEINDGLGHEAGDAALRAVAESLRESCRATDIPARFDGDEFAVLCPSTDAEEALQLADRILASVSSKDVPGAPVLSVSIGVAGVRHARDPDELRAASDRAMYAAKAAGGGSAMLAAPREVTREDAATLRRFPAR